MSSKRVYDIAKNLNISSKELISICAYLGIPVKSHSSSISDEQEEIIRKAFAAKKPEKETVKKADKKTAALENSKTSTSEKQTEKQTAASKKDKVLESLKKIKKPATDISIETQEDKADIEDDDFVQIEEEKFISKNKPKDKAADIIKPRSDWYEEKKLNIRKVLDQELDRQEKEGKFRPRVKMKSSRRNKGKISDSQKLKEISQEYDDLKGVILAKKRADKLNNDLIELEKMIVENDGDEELKKISLEEKNRIR